MGTPTRNDPLGVNPDPTSILEMLEGVVDARIKVQLSGRALGKFDNTSDMELVSEMLARGWAVFRPQLQGKP